MGSEKNNNRTCGSTVYESLVTDQPYPKDLHVHVQARLELALLGPQIYMYMLKPGQYQPEREKTECKCQSVNYYITSITTYYYHDYITTTSIYYYQFIILLLNIATCYYHYHISINNIVSM